MNNRERAIEGAKARWRDHKKIEWAVLRVPKDLLNRIQRLNPSLSPWKVIESLLEGQYSAEAR